MTYYFRNTYQREYLTRVIAHSLYCDVERCRMMGSLEEISAAEAFRIVRAVGHMPHVELWGIALEGFEYNDQRRKFMCTGVVVPRAVPVQGVDV